MITFQMEHGRKFPENPAKSPLYSPLGHQMASEPNPGESGTVESTEYFHATMTLLQKQLIVEQNRSKKLEADLEVEALKNQGMQMLFDCMQEERAENRRLKSLLKRKKLSWWKFKKLIQSVPNTGFPVNLEELSDASDVDESISNDLQKLELRERNGDNTENHCMASLSDGLNSFQMNQLHKRLELPVENEQFTSQLMHSADEKDAEIMRLKKKLKELENSNQINGILPDTLSDEAMTLKRHLAETAGWCQKLMNTLETKQNYIKNITNASSEMILSEASRNMDNVRLKQQYGNLEAKLKEVVAMNSRWQQYNEQREEYVQQLLQRNVELEQAIVNRGPQLSQAQQEHIDQVLLEQKQKLELTKEDKLMTEKENRRLKEHLNEMHCTAKKNDTMIRMLQEKLRSEEHDHAKDVGAHVEVNEALKVQLHMYREDFESERRDRERAQAHIEQLESQIRSASQQLSLNRTNANQEVLPNFDTLHYIRQNSAPLEASLVGRGTGTPDKDDRTDSGDLDLRPTD